MMAERVIEILKDSLLAEKLGRNAYQCASERHDPKIVVEDLLSAYREIVRT